MRLPIFAAALLLLAACQPDPTPTPTPTPAPTATPAPPGVASHSAAISEANALIAEVSVALASPARVVIEYANPDAGRFRTAPSGPAAEHAIPIVRLRAETPYSYAVGVEGANGYVFGPEGSFTTGPLPEALADVQRTVSGKSAQPLILTDLARGIDYPDVSAHIVVLDDEGYVVWHHLDVHVDPLLGRSGLKGVKQTPDGNFAYAINFCCIKEVTPLGRQVDQIVANAVDGGMHHDFVYLDDDRVLYLADREVVFDDSANGGAEETAAIVETLRVWDQRSGRTEEVWSAADFWDIESPDQRVQWNPARPPIRWVHANSLNQGPRGNFILSSRNRNQIFSVSPDFSEVEWQLGGPDSDYSFPNPDDQFYRQHSASELANGAILVFDNGATRPDAEGGAYSRALELRLDDARGTAEKVWEFRPDPDVYARNLGDVQRLPNGGTLINFGRSEDPASIPVSLIETAPGGGEAFRLDVVASPDGERLRSFAHAEITSIMGETKIE